MQKVRINKAIDNSNMRLVEHEHSGNITINQSVYLGNAPESRLAEEWPSRNSIYQS